MIFLNIFLSPMAAYFMALLWAALFGDTFFYWIEKSMIEEWVICIQLYWIGAGTFMLHKRLNKKID
jgi:hypothetical protein